MFGPERNPLTRMRPLLLLTGCFLQGTYEILHGSGTDELPAQLT